MCAWRVNTPRVDMPLLVIAALCLRVTTLFG